MRKIRLMLIPMEFAFNVYILVWKVKWISTAARIKRKPVNNILSFIYYFVNCYNYSMLPLLFDKSACF